MLKCNFMVLKPRLNTSDSLCGQTVILKTVPLLGNDIWTIRCTWLPEMSKYLSAVIQPFRVIIGPAKYQVSSHIRLHVSQFEPGIQDYRLPWAFGLMLGTRRTTHLNTLLTYLQSSDVQVLSSSHHLFCLLVLFSVIGGLAIAHVQWVLNLWALVGLFLW